MSVSAMANIAMKSPEVGEDYQSMIAMPDMPDPIAAMMMSEHAVREARRNKIEILRGIVTQRNHRRSTAILNNKEIREITAKIEENKIRILQIHSINSVLEQSRSHYIDEEMKKFDDENPCKEAEELIKLEKLEAKDREIETQKLMAQSNWGQTTGWSTITTDSVGPYSQQLTNTTDLSSLKVRYGTGTRSNGSF